ncbi:MAG: hypothetical protein ACFFAO_15100 [Candidatus Hermodarchaeota archaeon]
MNDNLILIAGGGKFGANAVKYAKKEKYLTILVDSDPNCHASQYADFTIKTIEEFEKYSPRLTLGDVIFLNTDITVINDILNDFTPKFIIPVVPVHLVFLIVKNLLTENLISVLPDSKFVDSIANKINPNLLLSKVLEKGNIYLSYAKINEMCPDNCSGPLNYCPNFKREKPITVTKYIKDFLKIHHVIEISRNKTNLITVLIESYQLKPGLGALKGEEIKLIMNTLKETLELLKNQNFQIITATTCNCHGVISLFKKK